MYPKKVKVGNVERKIECVQRSTQMLAETTESPMVLTKFGDKMRILESVGNSTAMSLIIIWFSGHP